MFVSIYAFLVAIYDSNFEVRDTVTYSVGGKNCVTGYNSIIFVAQ